MFAFFFFFFFFFCCCCCFVFWVFLLLFFCVLFVCVFFCFLFFLFFFVCVFFYVFFFFFFFFAIQTCIYSIHISPWQSDTTFKGKFLTTAKSFSSLIFDLSLWAGPFGQNFVPLTYKGSTLNVITTGPAVLRGCLYRVEDVTQVGYEDDGRTDERTMGGLSWF